MSKPQLNLVLLPGMDGTGRLFQRFLDVLPPNFSVRVVSYPAHVPTTYAEAEKIAWEVLPRGEEFVLLGESYSGPIALRIAARRPAGLRALVLAVSFAQSPANQAIRLISRLGSRALGIPPPAWLVRKFLLGPGAPAGLVAEFKQVVSSVRPEVLTARLKDIMAVDVQEELKACTYPLMWLTASEDRLVPAHANRRIREICPHAELIELEGPHCLLQRNPSAVVQGIREFLTRSFKSGAFVSP